MSTEPDTDLDRADVAAAADLQRQLAAADIDLADVKAAVDEQQATAEDTDGNVLSVSDLMDWGLPRRQALKAVGLVVAGATWGGALATVFSEPASAGTQSTGTIGTASDPVDVEAEDINAVAINTDQVAGKSLREYRIYHDGSEVVGVNNSGEVARGTDAATVWQTVLDDINNTWETENGNGNVSKFEPIATVSSGRETFSLSSGITVKDGAIVRDARFDGSGLASPSTAVTFGGPDDTFTHGAVGGVNVQVIDAADTAIRFRDVAQGHFQNLLADNPTGNGFHTQSSLLCSFVNLHTLNGGGYGYAFSGDGDSATNSNANTWVGCRAMGTGDDGWNITNGTAQLFSGITGESTGNRGIYNNTGAAMFLTPWAEQNQWDGLLDDGDRTKILSPRFSSNAQDTNSSYSMRLRGTHQTVFGPLFRTSGETFSNAGATDAHLWGVDSAHWGGGEGTRITYDGVGENGGDPNSTGQWNGNGREGVTAVDTTNSVVYHYRGGAWV